MGKIFRHKHTIRPRHKRKNWFISVIAFSLIQPLEESEIEYEFTKSQGAGGQHANKRLAKELIHWKLSECQSQQLNSLDKQRHLSHYQIEQGNASITFVGKNLSA